MLDLPGPFLRLRLLHLLVAARLGRCHSICRPFRRASESIYDGNALLSASKREMVWLRSNNLALLGQARFRNESWRPCIFDSRWASGAVLAKSLVPPAT